MLCQKLIQKGDFDDPMAIRWFTRCTWTLNFVFFLTKKTIYELITLTPHDRQATCDSVDV